MQILVFECLKEILAPVTQNPTAVVGQATGVFKIADRPVDRWPQST